MADRTEMEQAGTGRNVHQTVGARPRVGSLSPTQLLILAMRAVMETGIIVGLAYWGWQTGAGTIAKVALALGAPLIGFGFWGLVDFHSAG